MTDPIARLTAAIESGTIPTAEGGELLRFVLTREEHGEPHMWHQAHVIEVEGGRIVRDTVYGGDRWDSR